MYEQKLPIVRADAVFMNAMDYTAATAPGSGIRMCTITDWAEKGPIDKAPADRVLILYKRSKTGKPMGHTGIRLRDGRTVDARGHKAGTVLSPSIASLGWTDYAILPGQTEEVADVPANTRPTLRRGDKGDAVRELQTMLVAQGYDLPGSGIDGDYGPETRGAVLAFQDDRGLKMDGIVGPETWAALESEEEKAEGKPEDNPLDEWEILTDAEKLDNLHERLKRLEGRCDLGDIGNHCPGSAAGGSGDAAH